MPLVIIFIEDPAFMYMPPPLMIRLKKDLDDAQRDALIARIRAVKGVIEAVPRQQADPKDPVLAVLYHPGSKAADELRNMKGVVSVMDAPVLPVKRPPPTP
jgi:hypothetical protein